MKCNNFEGGHYCNPLAFAASKYAQDYGFFGLNTTTRERIDRETLWNGTIVPRPALNISAFYFPNGSQLFGREWVDPRTSTRPFGGEERDLRLAVPGFSNRTFSVDNMIQHGICHPQDTYQWGFSFLQVFIVANLLLVWTMGVWLVWLKAHSSLLDSKFRVPSTYQAILALAENIQSQFGPGRDVEPEKLDQHVATELDGGRISIPDATPLPNISALKLMGRWIKRNGGWFVGLFLLTAYVAVGWIYTPLLPYVTLVVFDITVMFALVVGRTRQSRLWMLFGGGVVALIVGLCVLAALGPSVWIYFGILAGAKGW